MHVDSFLHLHAVRSADLRREAAAERLARSAARARSHGHDVRGQLGWALVELGLRLVRTTAGGAAAENRFRTAGSA
ncbi:hypothetical protein ACIQM4_32600 [Streptomyces sp. NPDC091272]|uniref:hypothetical protein n=1 Tax=Streptomyces sp. NPDC091272 TaxID=3365981 RepID=UPI0038089923